MPESGQTDAELLADWLERRHEPAFHALVARYTGLVHMAGLRTCGDESLAAEASQLTFITLARKAKSLASRSSLAGWLHVTAVMQAKNLLRQRLRETRKRQLLRTHMDTDSHGQPADAWKQMQPVLDEALASLSASDREALLLRFYRSLSVREIGAALGIATDAAQKRLDRATERLRLQLSRRGCQIGTSLGAVMLAGFAADSQAAVPASSVLASKAIAAAGAGGATTLTTIGIIVMTKKAAIIAGAVVLLAGVGAVAYINNHKDESPAEKGHVAGNGSAPAAGTLAPVDKDAVEKNARSRQRDPAANPEFVSKFGEARTNLSKHVATNVISLLEDAVEMGEMAASGKFAGFNRGGGGQTGLGRLDGELKLSDEQKEKATAAYQEFQKREIVKARSSIEGLKKDPTPLMQMMLASDAFTRGEMTQEEYDQVQKNSGGDLKGVMNPLDRNNFRGGQPLQDAAYQAQMKSILDAEQANSFQAAADEQTAKAESDAADGNISNLPAMELEKLDQTVESAKKMTTGLKSMMEGMGGLQDLGPLMEQQRKAREAQSGAGAGNGQ